jgi:peptidoglycan hydrolase-like amidase
MKIVSINTSPTATNEKQISFNTDPPLTREVFDMYSLMVGRGNMFTMQNGLLTAQVNIDPRYLTQAVDSLTEAERQIENAKAKAIQARIEFLKKLSEKTGIPVGPTEPPVS